MIVVATDEVHHLRDCLPSLAALEGPSTEVIVVDNMSGDGTGAMIAAEFPWVRVVRTELRLGYADANNLGFESARGRDLIVLNPDTRVDPGFVRGLVELSRDHGDRVLVTSRICLFDDPLTLNTCGNVVQFGLLAACRGLGEPAERYARSEKVASISGCAFLMPRAVLDTIGPFDGAIVPYLEDTELSLRAWLCGYPCLTAPESLVYHKYRLRLTPAKFSNIERNRWLVLLRTYRLRTLLLLMPALVVIDVMAWAYAGRLGGDYVRAKARSYGAIVRSAGVVGRGRRRLRVLRRIGDRELLEHLQGRLPVSQLVAERGPVQVLIAVVDGLLAGYFALARRLVRW